LARGGGLCAGAGVDAAAVGEAADGAEAWEAELQAELEKL